MPLLKFDPEATVEEIAGIGRHAAFDAVINDKDDGTIQVVCSRADGTSLPFPCPETRAQLQRKSRLPCPACSHERVTGHRDEVMHGLPHPSE
jgi:hypothetical protein